MALNLHIEPVQVVSDRKGAISGPWFHLGGMSMDVQFHGPGAAHRIEVSADKQDADIATDADGVAITLLPAVYREMRERPEWVRMQILTDNLGPRIFAAEFLVHKEDF